MFEVSPLSSRSGKPVVQRFLPADRAAPQSARAEPATGDRVELSAAAQDHARGAETVRVLDERIRDLRARIAAGSYLTPDKIDYVVERLYEELFAVPHEA